MHDDVIKTEGRIKNTLEQRLRPRAVADRQGCSVSAFVCGDPVSVDEALSAGYRRSSARREVGRTVVDNLVQGLRAGAVPVERHEGRGQGQPRLYGPRTGVPG